MADDPISIPQVQQLISAMMSGMAKVGTPNEPIESRNMLSALNFLTAVLVEASPDTDTPGSLRKAVKIQSDLIMYHAKSCRQQYEESGIHTWQTLNRKRAAN
jgi:hypothetical protein